MSGLNVGQPMSIVDSWETEIFEFAQTFAHHVDIVNVQKLEGAVRIGFFVLIPATLRLARK